ncbi:MAG: TonB-dependent receptor, partial [Acidobacteria bacterium]|nr:TonB-dependent receptor [Acidobacteriota bacterium]
MNVTLSGDNAGVGGTFYRPDLVKNPNLPSGDRTRLRYFDPTAFAQPAPGKFGNSGRNVVRQGGVNNWDISIFKSFPLGWEGGRFEFRAEMFNAFNHTQWTGYRTAFGSTGFGSATGARDARSVQMGLKLYW